MIGKKKKKTHSFSRKRLSFPGDEEVYSWLSLLLDAHSVVDRGVAVAIRAEEGSGRQLACRRGCAHCCRTNRDIPVYPLELMGLSWYAAEKLEGALRNSLKKHLDSHGTNTSCPFLIGEECSVYLLRPMACRQFTVFEKTCAPDEDPYHTRPDDLLPPVRKHLDQAFYIFLPFHGVEKHTERVKAVESGAMHRLVKNLRTCDWTILSRRMALRDRERMGTASEHHR